MLFRLPQATLIIYLVFPSVKFLALTDRKLYSKPTSGYVSCCHRRQPASSLGAEESSIVGDQAIVEARELYSCARWEAKGVGKLRDCESE